MTLQKNRGIQSGERIYASCAVCSVTWDAVSYTHLDVYKRQVQYYTNKNIGVSYLRAKKQNDLDRVMALYGSPNERYW